VFSLVQVYIDNEISLSTLCVDVGQIWSNRICIDELS